MSEGQDRGGSSPQIDAQFDRPTRRYEPGSRLAVRYRVEGCDDDRIHAVEHSVLWYTEGKGEEDLGVHFFQRVTDRGQRPPGAAAGDFATTLPKSPLSYEGAIVKVRWCIRVRVFFDGSRDYVSEHVFEVGSVPPARLPAAKP
jgi:hypothetical protein